MAKDENGKIETPISKEIDIKTHKEPYSIDELVNHKHELVCKPVQVNGRLVAFKMGGGVSISNYPLEIELSGDEWKIYAYSKLNRLHSEDRVLAPYLKSSVGETIEAEIVFSRHYCIKKLFLSDKCFTFANQ